MGKYYEVWCQARIDSKPFPGPSARYVTNTWNEARRLKKQADHECQSRAVHFIRKLETPAPDGAVKEK